LLLIRYFLFYISVLTIFQFHLVF